MKEVHQEGGLTHTILFQKENSRVKDGRRLSEKRDLK